MFESDRTRLDKRESQLKGQIGEGDLLSGEPGFSRQDLEDIEKLLANTAFLHLREKRYSIEETLHRIEHQWPLTFALFLVLEGVYNYKGGNYWAGPIKVLGIQTNHTDDCGRLFLEILAKFNLPTFEQSGGFTYVTPILLHGGIPNDLLPDFFDFLWKHEARPHRIALDTGSLLQLWRREPELYLTYLPEPVKRFLRDGGSVAEDFVGRCLDLFHTTSLEESTELIDLPGRVLKAFWQWRESKGREIEIRPLRPRVRLQKPVITLAPYTTGIGLYLPPQQFPISEAPQTLTWHLQMDDNARQVIPTIRQCIEGGYHYAAQETAVPPARQYTLQLHADGELLYTWILPGLDSPPVLVFAPYDDYQGDALTEQERYRPGERWLLYPQDFEWKRKGQSHKIRDLPRLPGDWRAFKLEVWQLAPGEMALQDGNGRSHAFAVVHEQVHQKPYLAGGNRLPLSIPATDFPLYIGRPPQLVFTARQLCRWRIAVRAAGYSQPSGHRYYRLSQLTVPQQNDLVQLDLGLPELLGEIPVGEFEIVLRGPLGQSYNRGLRLIPNLEVSGLNRVYLEDVNTPARLQFNCDTSTEVRQNPRQEGVDVQGKGASGGLRQYIIEAQPDIQQLTLQLKHTSGVVIPLTIPVHRLRWGLYHGQADAEIAWRTHPSAIYPGSLLNAELWVDVPIVKEYPVYAGWQLVNPQGEVWREVRPADQPLQRRLRVALGELTAVWRERQETLCWQLVLRLPDRDQPLIIPAFFLLPTLDFGDLVYDWQTDGEQVHLTLLWERTQPGHYQLLLWPLDRPWVQEPVALHWPKTAETIADWLLSQDELPAEAYLAEVTAYNPWQSTQPQRPQPEQSNTVLIKPPELEQHYAEIAHLRDQGKATVEQLLALLAHQSYDNQKEGLYQTNKAIADQRESLSLTWLVRWLDLASGLDKTAHTLAQLRAFDQSIIERLARMPLSEDELDSYFRHLPDEFTERLCARVVQSGLRRPRERCLAKLCRLPLSSAEEEQAFQVAMGALLEDISDATLLPGKAVTWLTANAPSAADYLVENGSHDAAELLHELAIRTDLEPNWIATDRVLSCDLGQIRVEKLRHRKTNELRFCVPLKADYYAEGKLLLPPITISVRLDLSNWILRFNTTPYQCLHCQQLLSSMAAFAQHHETAHPGEIQSRKRLKRDEKLRWIRPRLKNE